MSDHHREVRTVHVSSRRRSPPPTHSSSSSKSQRDRKSSSTEQRNDSEPIIISKSKRGKADAPKGSNSPSIKSISSDHHQRGRRSRSPSVREGEGDSSGHTTNSSITIDDDNRKSKRVAVGNREIHANGFSSSPNVIIAQQQQLEVAVVDAKQRSPVKHLPVYLPAVQGCRSVQEFKVLNKIEEGTYGVVFRACERRTGEVIALKRLKMEREKDGFPITSLREVSCLLKAQHRNIVRVREIVVGDNMEQIFMVMDFVEHDLKTLMNSMTEPFRVGEVKTLMRQLLEAVAFLHDNWIIHRDLKTSNLLLSNKGVLKVADFGLAREYGSPIKPYTSVVVTLWYRAPELILGTPKYSSPIDLWSCGCIFAELLTLEPLFPGKTEVMNLC